MKSSRVKSSKFVNKKKNTLNFMGKLSDQNLKDFSERKQRLKSQNNQISEFILENERLKKNLK